jgi:hypothetical protein
MDKTPQQTASDLVAEDKDPSSDLPLPADSATWSDPGTPRCPPTSSLILTKEQEEKLVTFCCERVEEMKANNREWIEERNHYLDEHENRFKHREVVGSIFAKSNSSFNQSRRNAVPIIARLIRDFLGVWPFFACKPVRSKGSTVEPDAIQRYAEFKAGRTQGKLAESLMDGIEMGAVVGERVEKIVHTRRASFYSERANVLVDDHGQVVRTSQGEPVYDYDEWVDSSYFDQPDDGKDPQGQPGAPLPPPTGWSWRGIFNWGKAPAPVPIVVQPTGIMVLKKDPSLKKDPQGKYQEMLVDREEVLYEGPEVKGIHHGDFLCPLNAEDIQSAPYIAHLFDVTIPELIETYITPFDPTKLNPQEKIFYGNLLNKVKGLEGETDDPKSHQSKADTHNAEQKPAGNDKYNGVVQLAEVYLKADPKKCGRQSETWITLVLDKKIPLFYNYTAINVPPKIGRPFRPVRVTPKRGRWYGIGEYRLNEHKQRFIDWCLNKSAYSNAAAGKIRIYDAEAVEGWDEQEPKYGDVWYKKKSGFMGELEKAVVEMTTQPLDDDIKELRDAMMQTSQAERGNLSPGGDSLSQLPSSKLKYGIQAIERAGDEVYAVSAMNTEIGIADVTEAFILTMLEHMNPVEEFIYTDGDQYLSGQLTRSDIADLDMNVELEMTLTRGDQINEQNQLAYNIVLAYMGLPPFQQATLRDFTIARLKSMDIQNAEKAVPNPSPQDVQASYQAWLGQMEGQAMGGQPGQPGQPPPPGGPSAPPSPIPPPTDPAQPPPAGPKVI